MSINKLWGVMRHLSCLSYAGDHGSDLDRLEIAQGRFRDKLCHGVNVPGLDTLADNGRTDRPSVLFLTGYDDTLHAALGKFLLHDPVVNSRHLAERLLPYIAAADAQHIGDFLKNRQIQPGWRPH